MRGFLISVCLLMVSMANGQLLTWTPDYVRENASANIEITVDATRGNQGLRDFSNTSDVYIHTGLITSKSSSPSAWQYVKFTDFNAPTAAARCTYLSNNRWRFTITGGLRAFYNVTDPNERILKISVLFRSGNGGTVQRNTDGSDMYIPVYDDGLHARVEAPFLQPTFTPVPEPLALTVGDNLTMRGSSSAAADLQLFLNGTLAGSATAATSVSATVPITQGGSQVVVVRATNGTTTVLDTLGFFVSTPTPIVPLPDSVRDGINYQRGDTSVVLVLFAPGKSSVYVVGDFNNWSQQQRYQMNRTPDGNRFWIRITGLTPGTEYGYQYLVDGSLRIADYYTEKVLDPDDDPFIPQGTYPGLKPYPTGKTTGNVSVLQTAKPAYVWTTSNFIRPDKRNLIIYELLLRDFTADANWKTLTDTLSYLKRLGVNVIQLMPINEFEGNQSWGYNPSFYFAPDKYYGTENALRAFVDTCHANGIAVVLDIALNHSFGQSPMVQLYFDAAAGKPSTSSPWFNPDARHPFNVGFDFNHESQATKDFVDRVMGHWLQKYRIDGFRWDLSKGFTQVNNPNNVSAWSAYDASRIAIWKRIYDQMQGFSNGSYCILEHFADNREEIELADYGMLLWGNGNFNFNEATMGFTANSNFDGIIHKKRSWNRPHLIGYQESHDEERLMYKNITFGNSANNAHNTRNLSVALPRNGMATAFWAMIPGPKMLWQFGELGYDFSITYCPSTNTVPQPYPNMQCRVDAKPVRWDYAQNNERKALYNIYASLLQLRNKPNFLSTFTTQDNVSWDFSQAFKWLRVESDSLRVVVIGNFDVTSRTGTVTFPSAGTWYSYLKQGTRTATGGAETITLQPGEYYVYTNRQVDNPLITSINELRPDYSDQSLIVYPNPVQQQASLTYEIPVSGTVEVSVWNLQGQRTGTLFRGMKAKGKHTLQWNTQQLSPGRMAAGQYLVIVDVEGRRMKKLVMIGR
jgi:glycosidase